MNARVRLPARCYECVGSARPGDTLRVLTAGRVAGLLVQRPMGKSPVAADPEDEDFAAHVRSTVEDLLRPENRGKLVAIVAYHVVTSHAVARQHS